ncbi:MAG: hypothetical protein NWE94_08220 [Candidatus Bathyarchaeota archaeon]|nr:hypothetical protein [Candidatus Bathyarchaeota archaeon]
MYGDTEIFLADRAFLSLLLSSVEVYKRECHGILLGFKTTRRIIVEYAIPFQTAERKFNEVIPNWKKELKVKTVLPNLVHLQILGGFHSHPQFGKKRGEAKLSSTDKSYLEEGNIEIVIAINDEKKTCPWAETGNGLAGTIGGYHIALAGFYKRAKDQKIANYRIVCPYAVGFDYALKK